MGRPWMVALGLALGGVALAAGPIPQPETMLNRPAPGWEDVVGWVNLPPGKSDLGPKDFRGRVIVLFFWQKTCPGCQSHLLPLMRQAAERLGADPRVALVAVQTAFKDFETNTPAAVREVAERLGLGFPMGHAGAKGTPPQVLIRYQARGTPWIVLIDPQGVIRRSQSYLPIDDLVRAVEALKGPPAPKPPAEPAVQPAEKPLSPAAQALRERLQKVEARFMEVAAGELEVRSQVMTLQQKAMKLFKDQDEAARRLAKGECSRPLRAYQALMLECVRRLRALDARLGGVFAAVVRLRKNPAAGELEADFDRLVQRIEARRVQILDQVAGFFAKAGRMDEAARIYERLWAQVPPTDAERRRAYAEKRAAVYEKFEKWDKALVILAGIYRTLPPQRRRAEINLRIHLGNLYQRVGDYAKALEMYKSVKKDLPPGMTIQGLDDVIRQLEARV